MKFIKLFAVVTFAVSLMAASLQAADEHKQAGCCKKASADGKTCEHKCCVAAAKEGKECEKCGGKGELPKKEEKKEEKK